MTHSGILCFLSLLLKGNTSVLEDSRGPIELPITVLTNNRLEGTLESCVLESAGKKKSHCTSRGNWPWSLKEVGLLLCDRTGRNTGETHMTYLGASWYPCSTVTMNKQGCQPRTVKGMIIKGSDTSWIKVWLILSDKLLTPAEVIAEHRGKEFRVESRGSKRGRLVVALRSIAVMGVVHPLTSLFWVLAQKEKPTGIMEEELLAPVWRSGYTWYKDWTMTSMRMSLTDPLV